MKNSYKKKTEGNENQNYNKGMIKKNHECEIDDKFYEININKKKDD